MTGNVITIDYLFRFLLRETDNAKAFAVKTRSKMWSGMVNAKTAASHLVASTSAIGCLSRHSCLSFAL